MTQPAVAVHAACLLFVVADLWCRSERVRLMMRGAGSPISFLHALGLTAFGDAAALVTPWRAGGEIGRLVGARAANVPTPVAAGVLGLEFSVAYSIAAVASAVLIALYGGAWWTTVRSAGPDAVGAGGSLGPVIVGTTLVAMLALSFVPAVRAWLAALARGLRASLAAVRRIPPGTLALCYALSVLSLVARVSVLPVLALTLPDAPDAPDAGVLALVSFVLLYAQVAMPTPAGTGAVELAFLQGGVGFDNGSGAMLGGWRLYMTVLPAVFGFALGAVIYGRRAWQVLPFARRDRVAPALNA